MPDQADLMIGDMLREDDRRPNLDNIPLSAWEEGEFLNWDDQPYTYTATVWTYWDGCSLTATGTYCGNELQSVEDIEWERD